MLSVGQCGITSYESGRKRAAETDGSPHGRYPRVFASADFASLCSDQHRCSLQGCASVWSRHFAPDRHKQET